MGAGLTGVGAERKVFVADSQYAVTPAETVETVSAPRIMALPLAVYTKAIIPCAAPGKTTSFVLEKVDVLKKKMCEAEVPTASVVPSGEMSRVDGDGTAMEWIR